MVTSFSKDNYSVYDKEVSNMLGSPLCAIALQYISGEWVRCQKPFPIFQRPVDHPKYRSGISWKESCGFSEDDVRYAIPKIATKITVNKKESEVLSETIPFFTVEGRLQNAASLVAFKRDSINKLDLYILNEELLERSLQLLRSGEWVKHVKPYSPELRTFEKNKENREKLKGLSSFSDIGLEEFII